MAMPLPYDFGARMVLNKPRSVFDRSHRHLTTMRQDYLIPFYVDEVLPGDTFSLKTNAMVRFNDLLRPYMDNLYMDIQYFFVPSRLIWDHWEHMCGYQENPGDSTDYRVPVVEIPKEKLVAGSIYTYAGLPYKNQIVSDTLKVNALPLRAMNFIYNQWYRDENLIDSLVVNKGDSGDSADNYNLFKRGKRHDYFTSCLPAPQKGPDVQLPIGTYAPVIGNGKTLGLTNGQYNFGLSQANWSGTIATTGYTQSYGQSVGYDNVSSYVNGDKKSIGLTSEGANSGVVADLSEALAVSINQIRQCFAMQSLFELDQSCGTRYFEILMAHFGVVNPDLRLSRPQLLGYNSMLINVNTVAQTSAATQASPQANLAGYGVGFGSSGFQTSFGEFGYVIGFASIRADLTYQQGLNKMWSRSSRYDFYWPAFAFLGAQPVLRKELYCTGEEENDNEIFGWQDANAEYRYKPSIITGHLNSMADLPMDNWHLSQKFEEAPLLNEDFIEENVPIDRVTAVTNEQHFLTEFQIHLICARPIPLYSIPAKLGKF